MVRGILFNIPAEDEDAALLQHVGNVLLLKLLVVFEFQLDSLLVIIAISVLEGSSVSQQF